MNPALGSPVTDLDDFLETVPHQVPSPPPEPAAPAPPAGRPRWLWWVMAGIGALLFVAAAIWLSTSQARPDAPGAPNPPSAEAGVPAFAELVVAAHLGGSSSLAELLPGATTPLPTSPGHYVTRAAAIEISEPAPGYWTVLVAADVLERAPEGYAPVGLQFYRVGVFDDGGRLVAAALPGRVAGPPLRPSPPRALQTAQGAPSTAHVALAGDFMEALLTGARDINRYTDGSVAAIVPPPYEAVAITSLALHGDGSALATVKARTAAGNPVILQYVLGFTTAGGRLLVTDLRPGPPLHLAAE